MGHEEGGREIVWSLGSPEDAAESDAQHHGLVWEVVDGYAMELLVLQQRMGQKRLKVKEKAKRCVRMKHHHDGDSRGPDIVSDPHHHIGVATLAQRIEHSCDQRG